VRELIEMLYAVDDVKRLDAYKWQTCDVIWLEMKIEEGQMSYTLNVRGRLWQGSEATYSYKDTPRSELHKRCVPISPDMTEQQVRSYAGDFESVMDWQIIETIQSGDWHRRIVEHNVAKDWALEDSEEMFLSSMA
jgi:hypothetical protein